MSPISLVPRRLIGEDVVLLMEKSPGSFLLTLTTPHRARLTSLVDVTAYSWTFGNERDDPPSSEESGRDLDTAGDEPPTTSVAFIGVVIALVVG